MDFLNSLNDAQRKAVEYTEGPSMVIAGAGSGKTRVLTYRIALLLYKGVPPYNILALTFTNKAAREMKERIGVLIGEDKARNLWMGTFHSVFAKILRIEAEKIGYPSNFTIYDTDDSKRLIKTIIKELKLDDKIYRPSLVLNRISMAKNNLLTPQRYSEDFTIRKEDVASKKPELGKIFSIYNTRLFKSGAMDFDDLLFNMNILLRDHEDVLYKYQNKFRYILVDEYQDTNFSQYIIVKALAARFQNICVVGDDAQSIYSFRGANIQNILNFKRDYDDVAVFKLEQNYRSTKNIVSAANSLIEKNVEQIKKEVWTTNEHGEKITVTGAMSDSEEAMNIAYNIFHKKNNYHASNNAFAILYRTNAQSRALEDALRKLNIPYRIYGGLLFYQGKEIKDLLAYYRLVLNPKDEDALKRIINYPARGIGKTTMDKIELFARMKDISLWEVVSNIERAPIKIHSGSRGKVKAFADLIEQFRVIVAKLDAFEAGKQIAASTGILKELGQDKTVEGVSRYENVQELLNSMKEFTENDENEDKSLGAFIQDVPLLTDQDTQKDENEDKVTLMTIHASKGLEFPYVYVTGLEENLFPSMLSTGSRADLEEERRLFYVAITRAKKEVNLSYAMTRYKWGDLQACEPSRFLKELDPKYVTGSTDLFKDKPNRSWDQATRQRSVPKPPPKTVVRKNLVKVSDTKHNRQAPDQETDIRAGQQVEHARFGRGTVVSIEGPSGNKKAVVDFDRAGRKILLLKFAKLTVLK